MKTDHGIIKIDLRLAQGTRAKDNRSYALGIASLIGYVNWR